MKEQIRILLADDYPLFMEGIRLMLEGEAQIVVAGEAADGLELLHLVNELSPDVVITDIEMPRLNGIEATRCIKQQEKAPGVIALTMFGEDHLLVDMMEAGANGYLLKSTKKEELLLAISSAKEGGMYFCEQTTLHLSKLIAKSKMLPQPVAVQFSENELAIIQLICEQYASKEIADKTNLSFKTVEKYRVRIMEKTGAKNVVGIVIYAITHDLYKTQP